MDLTKLSEPLSIDNIEFRIQSINKGGYATILAYKDARVDMQRLDEVCGALNWKREHTRDNHNCIISIWDESKKQWVSKEDTGKESFTEKEKGLASDSFKRAGFNWGIGRELYDYPLIQAKLNKDEYEEQNGKVKQTWKLKLKDWTWKSDFKNGKITFLEAIDQDGNQRFKYPSNGNSKQNGGILEAVNEMKAAKSLQEAKSIWFKYEKYQNHEVFELEANKINEKFKNQ